MPKIFDMSAVDWPEDDDAFYPKPSQFDYLTPETFGGRREPVRFSIANATADGRSRMDVYLQGSEGATDFTRGLLGRLRALFGVAGTPSPPSAADWRREQAQREAAHTRQLFDSVLPILTDDFGVVRLYGRYDGGNDEGFAWLDHVVTRDGEKLSVDEIATAVVAGPRLEALRAARLVVDSDLEWNTPERQVADLLSLELSGQFATWLLGTGFGTGEYMMYGGFIVDLEAQTIHDDPDAAPVVQNIELADDA